MIVKIFYLILYEYILILFQQTLTEFLQYLDSILTNGGYRKFIRYNVYPKGVSGLIFSLQLLDLYVNSHAIVYSNM